MLFICLCQIYIALVVYCDLMCVAPRSLACNEIYGTLPQSLSKLTNLVNL